MGITCVLSRQNTVYPLFSLDQWFQSVGERNDFKGQGGEKTKGGVSWAKQHKEGENAQLLIDHWVIFSRAIPCQFSESGQVTSLIFLKFYLNCLYPIWWTSANFEWNMSRNGMTIKHLVGGANCSYLAMFNTSTAGPRYIRGCCLMLERRYGFCAGAWVGKVLF